MAESIPQRAVTRTAESSVRWRARHFPCGESHRPVLVVSSTSNGTTLYLYALNFVAETAGPADCPPQPRSRPTPTSRTSCRTAASVGLVDPKPTTLLSQVQPSQIFPG